MPADIARSRGARPALGARQSAAYEGGGRQGAALGQPGSPDPGHNVVSGIALVALADGVRSAPVAAGAIHHTQLLPRRFLAVPILAGVRSGAGAEAVRPHHGGAVHAEGA